MTSSSNGTSRSKRYSWAERGSTALRTTKRLVHSAEVWLKRRRRARHARRRYQSCGERERGYDEGVGVGLPLFLFSSTHAQYQGQIVRFARDDSVAGHLRQRPPALRHLHVQQRSSHRNDISLLEKTTHNQCMEIALLPVPSEISHRTPLGREYVFREEGSQRISLAYARVIHQRLGQPPRQME